MRVGITVLTKAGDNIWNNGIGQNVYFLASLLADIPFVQRVVLLDCGDHGQPPDQAGPMAQRFPITALRDAADHVDVAIEVAGGLDSEWTARFRARGGRVVFHVCGHPYASLVEPTIFNRPAFFGEADRCDEVWTLAKDRPFTAFLRAIHRCAVIEVPYLWEPSFLNETAAMVSREGLAFGYKPGSLTANPAVPAIFEPNISPLKMGTIPFMICDGVARETPDAIAKLRCMNMAKMKDHPSFVYLVGNSGLYKTGKVSLEDRDYFARVMGQDANIVASHQMNWSQNYLYFDALHGGYPLVHNSPLFGDVGYFYPDCDIGAGIAQFRLAVAEHDRNLKTYIQRAHAKIAAHSPSNRDNRDAYARRLLALAPQTAGHA